MSEEMVPAADLAESQAQTRAAFANRARLYRYFYEELAAEVGTEQATIVMKRAIRRRGVEVGAMYHDAVARRDLDAVGQLFCATSPCEGALFEPGIESRDSAAIVLRMTACPLVDTWREMGLSDTDIDLMCDIAAEVDEGTFEGAGLKLTFLDRMGQPSSCRCLLQVELP